MLYVRISCFFDIFKATRVPLTLLENYRSTGAPGCARLCPVVPGCARSSGAIGARSNPTPHAQVHRRTSVGKAQTPSNYYDYYSQSGSERESPGVACGVLRGGVGPPSGSLVMMVKYVLEVVLEGVLVA